MGMSQNIFQMKDFKIPEVLRDMLHFEAVLHKLLINR
jgi:hypothetical protein